MLSSVTPFIERHDRRAAAAAQGRIPEGFPAAFAPSGARVSSRGVPRRTAAALLERERELATLSRRVRTGARRRRGRSSLIEGPAGVGKTELAREARAAAEQAGLTPLEARGSELEQPFAFGVVRQLLEPVIARTPGTPICSRARPVPRRACSSATSGASAGADAGFEALHSLYWLVVNLADRAPLLVLVDDCQWVDQDSLRFLAYLAQRIEGLPVAMLLAGRPPDPTRPASAVGAGGLAPRRRSRCIRGR